MRQVFTDLETFWSKTHSLSKMSPIAYCKHPDTELISASFQEGTQGVPFCVFGEDEIRRAVVDLKLDSTMLIAHNMSGFDAMIFAWRLFVKPRIWGCTLAMARPIHAKHPGLSLAKLVAHYKLGVKDATVLHETQGRRLKDFTQVERARMAKYNCEDVSQCAGLYSVLAKHYTPDELWHLDCNIRMLVEPKFVVDTGLLNIAASIERSNKLRALHDVARHLRDESYTDLDWDDMPKVEAFVRSELASQPKFAALLEARGVEVPLKPSPTNPQNMVPALAKSDEAFVELTEHDDELVAAAARARLEIKSTITETRIEAFLATAALVDGKLPVPLNYCGADTTGRDSGWQYNPQNLARITTGKSKPSDALRNCLLAPKGQKIGVADQSGIELRMNHTLWKVPSTMELYAKDPQADLYKDFAAFYYQKQLEEVTKAERQFAKVCIAEDTLVLTNNGLKPIQSVSPLDLLWDGIEWVTHDGPVFNGEQEVITYEGITATPDHVVWVEDGRALPIGDAAAQLLRLAITGDGRLPVGFVGADRPRDNPSEGVQVRERPLHGVSHGADGCVRLTAQGHLDGMHGLQGEMRSAELAATAHGSGATAMHESERPVVPPVRGPGGELRVRDGSGVGGMGDGEPGAGPQQGAGPDRQQQRVRTGQPAVGRAQAEHGEPARVKGGGVPHVPAPPPGSDVLRQHPSESARAEHDLRADRGTVPSPEPQTKRRVWDILNAGPRNRFTAGGRLVSNCHLGLGFGSGHKTFMRIARMMGGLKLDEATSENAVSGWRSRYPEIVNGWKQCGAALYDIARRTVGVQVDPWGLVTTTEDGFLLPSGRRIRYPGLRFEKTDQTWEDGRPKSTWVYAEGRHKAFLSGPKCDENIIQALARDSVFECALRFFKETKLRPIMRVHDELVYMFPESEAPALLELLQKIMRTPPSWMPDIVLWSEGDIADSYGAAK